MLDKLKSKLSDQSKKIREVIFIEDSLRQERLDTCLSCNNLELRFRVCKLCGCLVDAKTKLLNSKCPIKKW